MKKSIILLIIFLLFHTSINAIGMTLFQQYSLNNNVIQNYKEVVNKFSNEGNNLPSEYIFFPEDIELKDDAYHKADTIHFTEWWYFDAIFDNGYTAQIGFRVLEIVNQGLVYVRVDIYKEGELESHELKKYFIWDFTASEDVPLLILNGKQVMEGYINETNGKWIYDLSLELEKSSIDLHFIGCTKGWKGITQGGKWAVILPKAKVSGKIKVNNEEINVNGIGYHDHNWEITVFTGINFGWFWGKVNSNNHTMTWAKIMTTRFWGQPLLVINKKCGEYINIEPENIQLTINEIRIKNGMLVPYSFILKVENKDVSLQVNMDVIDTHHVRWVGAINYWRYHIRCTGSITIDSLTESINELQLAEFIRFR